MNEKTIIRSENVLRYFRDIKNPIYNPITDDSVMRAMFRGDRQQFKDIVINSHIRLVASLAKSYDNGDKFMDYNQVGIEGLLEAFEKYDPEQSAKFSSYAAYWIKARMSMLCREFNMIQRTNQGKIGSKAVKFQEKFYKENMREATPSEIVGHLSANCNIDIKNCGDVLNISISSINTVYDDEKSTEECGEFAMKTSSTNGYVDTIEKEDLSDAVRKLMMVLTAKEKDFVIRHIYNNESYEVIAENVGCSIERVRQIVVGALKKMKSSEFAKTRFGGMLK